MPLYNYTTIYPLVARVFRNIRMIDMSYSDDIIEWIGEGIDRMRIKYRAERYYHSPEIVQHSAKLPCGLISIDGVVYNGKRLRYGFGINDPRITPWNRVVSQNQTTFISDVNVNQQDYSLVRGLDLKGFNDLSSTNDYYFIDGNRIKTSFESAKEKELYIFYRKLPTDNDGYPLVPDIEEAREALFWYVAGKLVFSGFRLPDPRIDYDYCDTKATKFFRKAMNEIKRMGVDEKESMLQSWVTLIPPRNYYDNFFINSEQPQGVKTHD